MNSSTWGTSVDIKPWFVDVSKLEKGVSVNIVVAVITVDTTCGSMLGTLYPGNQRVRISGANFNQLDLDSVSIFDATFQGCTDLPWFAITPKSKVMTFPKIEKSDLDSMVEFCAGMGISTIGFEAAGFTVKAAVEIRPKMASMYAQMHPNISIITGDMCCPDTIYKVWQIRPRSSTLFSGFACQPYSKGGKQLGVEDQRSSTLRASLEAAFMLRAPMLILECVKEASSNAYVQQEINLFCSQCRFCKSEIILSMEDCWPVRRERWWIILSAPMIGSVHLRKCPLLSQPSTVGMIMNGPMNIPEDELSQLEIGEEEYSKILMYVDDIKSLFLKTQTKAPTALHAWGAQVIACPCDCRPAFSDSTLASRGIYGVVIPIPGIIHINGRAFPRIRHPHPSEVAAWNCVPVDFSWPSNMRLVLTGLGQMATPVHAAWISSQLKMHIEQLLYGVLSSDCHRVLDNIRLDVLLQCKNLFPPRESNGSNMFVEPVPRVLPVEEDTMLDFPEPPCVDEVSPEEVQAACPWWFGLHHEGQQNQVTVVYESSFQSVVVELSSPETTSAIDLISGEHALTQHAHEAVVDCNTKLPLAEFELIAGRCVALIQPQSMSLDDETASLDAQPVLEDGYDDSPLDGMEVDLISPTWPFTIHDDHGDIHTSESDLDHVTSAVTTEVPDTSCEVEPLKTSANDGIGLGPSLLEENCEPLCKLNPEQLLQIQAPVVSTVFSFESFCKQTMPSVARKKILTNQDSLMGDDEIRFHASEIMKACSHSDWFFLDPILAHSIMMNSNVLLLHEWARHLNCAPKVVLTVIWLGGHWVPFQATVAQSCLHVSSWDDSGTFPKVFKNFVDLLSKELGCSTYSIRVEHRRFGLQGFCGICAVRFLATAVKGRMLPTCVEEVIELHEKGQSIFVSHLDSSPTCSRPIAFVNCLSSMECHRIKPILESISSWPHLALLPFRTLCKDLHHGGPLRP